MRADQLIVQRGLAPTRSAAQRLIAHGAVRWRGPRADDRAVRWRGPRADDRWAVPYKAGEDLPEACELEVTDDAELRWVSRAGLKLDAALAHTGIDVGGGHCLDVGQSAEGESGQGQGGDADGEGNGCKFLRNQDHGHLLVEAPPQPRPTPAVGPLKFC